jgi:hypothetical protein
MEQKSKPEHPIGFGDRVKDSKEFVEELNALTYLLQANQDDKVFKDYIEANIRCLLEWYYGVDRYLKDIQD